MKNMPLVRVWRKPRPPKSFSLSPRCSLARATRLHRAATAASRIDAGTVRWSHNRIPLPQGFLIKLVAVLALFCQCPLSPVLAQCPEIRRAKFECQGQGYKEVDSAAGPWQTINYNYTLACQLTCRLLQTTGDSLIYKLDAVKGTVHFSGTAREYSPDLTDQLNCNADVNLDLTDPEGFVVYSLTENRITDLAFPIQQFPTPPTPYYVEYSADSEPFFARLYVILPATWWFDDAYDSCLAPSAHFGPSITASGMEIYYSGVEYDSYYTDDPHWKIVQYGAYLDADFSLDELPWSVTLRIRHLSSAHTPCPGGGYSPVNILVNGTLLESCYDAAQAHGGTHGFVTDEWEIAAYLRPGLNTVSIEVCDSACSHYWISDLSVRPSNRSCTQCSADFVKEFMITFDDGPFPGSTDAVLNALTNFCYAGRPVRAAFFMVGDDPEPPLEKLYYEDGEKYTSKGSVHKYNQLVQRVHQAGHLVGNHTQHHAWFGWPLKADWALLPDYPSVSFFVAEEVTSANAEINNVLGTNLAIFRVPYLYEDHPAVWEVPQHLGYETIWGSTVWDVTGFLGIMKMKTLFLMSIWDKTEPKVFIAHDVMSETYEHIGDLLRFLIDAGYALVDFDPARLSSQKGNPNPPELSGFGLCPVDIEIVDPDGLVLSKTRNQIRDAIYKEVDAVADVPKFDGFRIAHPKVGVYRIRVIPEPGALSEDTYSLIMGGAYRTITLAQDVPVGEATNQTYAVCFTGGDVEPALSLEMLADGRRRLVLYGDASSAWRIQGSPNLSAWDDLGQMTFVGSRGVFVEEPNSPTAQRFYRAVLP
jgi:peptidoglycan/xylan/chitin deacetylase (PgdA/CDA1 family)